MYFTFWLAEHRSMMIAFVAVFMWVFANYWYLRRDIAKWKRKRRPRSWSADMATKTGRGGRGPSA